MSFIDLSDYSNENMDKLEAAPEGEYNVRIVKFKMTDDGDVILHYGDEDDPKPYIMPILEIIDDPNSDGYKEFTQFLSLPHGDMTGKEKRRTLNSLNEFGQCFDFNFFGGQMDPADLIDKCGRVYLSNTEDAVYGEQNKIKQFLIAR